MIIPPTTAITIREKSKEDFKIRINFLKDNNSKGKYEKYVYDENKDIRQNEETFFNRIDEISKEKMKEKSEQTRNLK